MTLTRALLVAAAFSLAALCLAACATAPAGPSRAAHAVNPIEHYPLKADAATDRIALALHDDGLSPAQSEAIKALAARRARVAGGVVTISLPRGAADPAAAARAAGFVQGLLEVTGAPTERSAYDSADPKAPLLVSFTYEKAEIPACGKDWGDLTSTFENRTYDAFGCAVTANMAAQIADPNDLAHPRAEDAPSVERRMTVLDRYRAGKVTAADEPQAKAAGEIAHVGQ